MEVTRSQGVFLTAYSLMHSLAFLLTWEMVLNSRTAVELGALPALAIEKAGTLGLLLVVAFSYLIMLAFWSGWVLSKGRNSAMLAFFQSLAIGSFAVSTLDFTHDFLAFAFGYFGLASAAIFNPISRFIVIGSAVFLVGLTPKLLKKDWGPGLLRARLFT